MTRRKLITAVYKVNRQDKTRLGARTRSWRQLRRVRVRLHLADRFKICEFREAGMEAGRSGHVGRIVATPSTLLQRSVLNSCFAVLVLSCLVLP